MSGVKRAFIGLLNGVPIFAPGAANSYVARKVIIDHHLYCAESLESPAPYMKSQNFQD